MNLPSVALVSLSTLAVGGIETNLLQLIDGLRDSFSFTVIGTLAEPFFSRASALGAACVNVTPGGKFDPGMVLRLRREFLQGKFSLIHTHDTRGGLLGRIAAKGTGIPALHTVHTPSFFIPHSRFSAGVYRAVERILNSNFSTGVIFVSPTIQRMYLDEHLISVGKAHLVPNGLEKEWQNLPPKQPAPGGDVVFLYVGRLAPEKGLATLAEAFSRVTSLLPTIRLVIVGDGPLRESVEQAARRDGWQARLSLAGRLDRNQARRIMQSADVFILPSRFESMSYTLLEAMACGLACIATDVGGNRDLVIPEKTGLLVPAGDPIALGEAIKRLADLTQLRREMGAAGQLRAREFSLDKMLAGTRQVYMRSIKSASPSGLE